MLTERLEKWSTKRSMRELDDGTTKLPSTYWEISWIVVYVEKVNSKIVFC